MYIHKKQRHFILLSSGNTFTASSPMSAAKKIANKYLKLSRKKKLSFKMMDIKTMKVYAYSAIKSNHNGKYIIDIVPIKLNQRKSQKGCGNLCDDNEEINIFLHSDMGEPNPEYQNIMIYDCISFTLKYRNNNKRISLFKLVHQNKACLTISETVLPDGKFEDLKRKIYISQFYFDENDYLYIDVNGAKMYLNNSFDKESNDIYDISTSSEPNDNTFKRILALDADIEKEINDLEVKESMPTDYEDLDDRVLAAEIEKLKKSLNDRQKRRDRKKKETLNRSREKGKLEDEQIEKQENILHQIGDEKRNLDNRISVLLAQLNRIQEEKKFLDEVIEHSRLTQGDEETMDEIVSNTEGGKSKINKSKNTKI